MRRAAGVSLALGVLTLSGCGKPAVNAAANAPGAPPAPAAQAAAAAPSNVVPFVGCDSDGQTGPQSAPSGQGVAIAADPTVAAQLAYYSSGDLAVLGPRGWNCFGDYGSDGENLFVAPAPITFDQLMADPWAAGAGPAIEVSHSVGDTSGRFEVAKVIARVFPARAAFAKVVIAEGVEPPESFPFGPYATDALTQKTASEVEFETPANAQGLGVSASRLTPSGDPVDGVALLQGSTPDLLFLAVRLPAAQKALTPAIVAQLEADAAKAAQAPAANATNATNATP